MALDFAVNLFSFSIVLSQVHLLFYRKWTLGLWKVLYFPSFVFVLCSKYFKNGGYRLNKTVCVFGRHARYCNCQLRQDLYTIPC